MSRAAARTDREKRILIEAQAAPMRPQWMFTRTGWDRYVHEHLEPPDLQDCAPPGTPVADDDPRLVYNSHLRLVTYPAFDTALLKAHRVLWANRNRRDGFLDMSIDGPAGTGKSLLLREIGRSYQQSIEKHYTGRIPVIHILAPQDTDSLVNWVWEIARFLALAPEPKNEEEMLQPRRVSDLSGPVQHVLERSQTGLLLIDDIQRVTTDQLAPVLHYFDYLRNRLGISTVFCGTGAQQVVHSARIKADDHGTVESALRQRLPSQKDERNATLMPGVTPGRLPVTWVDPLPFHQGDQITWPRVLRGFEQDLRLHRLSENALVSQASDLHQRTGGYLKLASQLICQAAVAAIEEDIEDITPDLIASINMGG
ncbi:ATP-binding protein [Streptomyces sp. NPDC005078]|uniref:ATP-binding protein n=1 Tax=Streptomyces sp. NPDC005078 TaxID=3154293 RepID=UPI00339F348A